MRTLQKRYIVALLLYPAFVFVLFLRVTKASVHNWMFLGMSLPHFCVWLALLSIPFALQVKRWNSKWLKWIDRNFRMFIVVGLVVLLGARYVFDVLPAERVIANYIGKGTFEKEPWKSRIMEDLDEDFRGPKSNYPVYPLYNSAFSVVHILFFSLRLGDSRESVEELLEGMKSFPVMEEFHGKNIACTKYVLPLGYFRYTHIKSIQYENGVSVNVISPQWFWDFMT